MLKLVRVTNADMVEVSEFLSIADLTLSGLDSSSVHLWISRDETTGRIFATTGYESSEDGEHALIRSVAVAPELRGGRNRLGFCGICDATSCRGWSKTSVAV